MVVDRGVDVREVCMGEGRATDRESWSGGRRCGLGEPLKGDAALDREGECGEASEAVGVGWGKTSRGRALWACFESGAIPRRMFA